MISRFSPALASSSDASENTSLCLYFPGNHVACRKGQKAEADYTPLPDFCFNRSLFKNFSWLGNQANAYFHVAVKPSPRCASGLTCCTLLMCFAAFTEFLSDDFWPPNRHFKGSAGCQFHEQHGENSIAQQGTEAWNWRRDSWAECVRSNQLSLLSPQHLTVLQMIINQHPCARHIRVIGNWNQSWKFRAEWARVRWRWEEWTSEQGL